jgi:hypothetical protein
MDTMSGTRRTPIGRTPTGRFTPHAVELFDAYRRARTDERQTQLHSDLIDELGYPTVTPWMWPCVIEPDDYTDPQSPSERLWVALDAASKEARRARRKPNGVASAHPPAP